MMIGASRIAGDRDLMHASQKAVETRKDVRFVVTLLFENRESISSPSTTFSGGFA
jgi:hypothetical protein